MRLEMAIHVHAHEGGELDETDRRGGLLPDSAPARAISSFRTIPSLALGKLVDLGRVDAGVDRPAISVIDAAAPDCRAAITLAATSRLTQGWQTRPYARPGDLLEEADDLRGVVVEGEGTSASGTSRALCQSVI